MSWHFKFVADSKEDVRQGINAHMAMVDSDYLCQLTAKMHEAVSFLLDNQGIAWMVESFGHVGANDGCNFTFKVEPVNTACLAINAMRLKHQRPAPPSPSHKESRDDKD